MQRSGVARSTIYRHWPRRTDLVADTFRSLIPPLPAVPAAGDLRTRLQVVLHGLAAQINDEKYAALVPAVLDSAFRDPELAEFRDDFARSQRASLDGVLHPATAAGEAPNDIDRDGAIAALVGPLFFRRVILRQRIDAAYTDQLIDAFLKSHPH